MSDNEWTTVTSKKQAPPKNTVSGFEHQNWDKTVIHGKPSTTTQKTTVRKNMDPEAIRLAKLANDEPVKIKSLSISDRQEIIKGRVAKGFNQDKFAQELCIPSNLYKDIENGKSIPSQVLLNKINYSLGTKVKLT